MKFDAIIGQNVPVEVKVFSDEGRVEIESVLISVGDEWGDIVSVLNDDCLRDLRNEAENILAADRADADAAGYEFDLHLSARG